MFESQVKDHFFLKTFSFKFFEYVQPKKKGKGRYKIEMFDIIVLFPRFSSQPYKPVYSEVNLKIIDLLL